MKEYDVIFPHLFGGIKIEHLDPVAFRLFGLEVYWYGIIIRCQSNSYRNEALSRQ